MRTVRSVISQLVSLVALVFAVSALYNQARYVNQNHAQGHSWAEAIRMRLVGDWPLILLSLAIIGFVLWLNISAMRQAERDAQKDREVHERVLKALEENTRVLSRAADVLERAEKKL